MVRTVRVRGSPLASVAVMSMFPLVFWSMVMVTEEDVGGVFGLRLTTRLILAVPDITNLFVILKSKRSDTEEVMYWLLLW